MFDAEALVPIFAILMVFGIPMVAILTAHQRKMAELMRGNQTNDQSANLARELQMMREEVRSLKDQVNRQALVLDDRGVQPLSPDVDSQTILGASQPQRNTPPDLPNRL